MRPPPNRSLPTPPYTLGLDVLRAAAICMVMASHAANNVAFWFGLRAPGTFFFAGDLGVDLFFALSGFLIGRILVRSVEAGCGWGGYGRFLARRAMRTLPAYYVCMAVLFLAGPPEARPGWYLLHFGTLTQNMLQPMPDNHWFVVSWSLTVEEWFYVLFGGTAILAAAILRRSWAIWIPLTMLLAGPAALRLSVPEAADYASGVMKMVPFRMDEIGIGVVFAWLEFRTEAFARNWLPALATGLCLIAAAWLDWLALPFRVFVLFRNEIAALGGALCIPACIHLQRAPAWFAAPARALSRRAYVLYLVHLSVLVDLAQVNWMAHRISAWTAVAIFVAGTAVCAEILSRWVERPFMRLRPAQILPAMRARTGLIIEAERLRTAM